MPQFTSNRPWSQQSKGKRKQGLDYLAQLPKGTASARVKPAVSEVPGKPTFGREKAGQGREPLGSSKNKTSKGTEVVGASKTPAGPINTYKC